MHPEVLSYAFIFALNSIAVRSVCKTVIPSGLLDFKNGNRKKRQLIILKTTFLLDFYNKHAILNDAHKRITMSSVCSSAQDELTGYNQVAHKGGKGGKGAVSRSSSRASSINADVSGFNGIARKGGGKRGGKGFVHLSTVNLSNNTTIAQSDISSIISDSVMSVALSNASSHSNHGVQRIAHNGPRKQLASKSKGGHGTKQIQKTLTKKPKKKKSALNEIRRLQKSTECLITKAGLRFTARKILQDPDVTNFTHFQNNARLASDAFQMLRESAEMQLIKHLENSLHVALRAKRVTVYPLDFALALSIQGERKMDKDQCRALPVTQFKL